VRRSSALGGSVVVRASSRTAQAWSARTMWLARIPAKAIRDSASAVSVGLPTVLNR